MAKKVLLIEDSPLDAEIAKSLLEKEDVEVEVAISGKEGIKKAGDMKPDLILLDLILPDIDGFKVCSEIKKDPALNKTIIVILSIRDKMDDITKAFTNGADDYIIKPPVPEFLVKKVKLYLGMK